MQRRVVYVYVYTHGTKEARLPSEPSYRYQSFRYLDGQAHATTAINPSGSSGGGADVRVTDLLLCLNFLETREPQAKCTSLVGCGRALLWNALTVARRALGARWKDQHQSSIKSSAIVNSVNIKS